MLGFVLKVLLPLMILLSPFVKVSNQAPALSYALVFFLLSWLIWGVISLLRSSSQRGKTNRSGADMMLEGVPVQYSLPSDHDVLGVSKEADKPEIEAAYQAKMANFDSERIAKMGKSVQEEIKAKQDRIQKAYENLMQQ